MTETALYLIDYGRVALTVYCATYFDFHIEIFRFEMLFSCLVLRDCDATNSFDIECKLRCQHKGEFGFVSIRSNMNNRRIPIQQQAFAVGSDINQHIIVTSKLVYDVNCLRLLYNSFFRCLKVARIERHSGANRRTNKYRVCRHVHTPISRFENGVRLS